MPTEDIYPLRYSSTKVNTGFGVWGNKRIVVGIRIDEKLYKAFKPVAKRVFGSTCRAIEAYMVSILATQKADVNICSTVKIEKIVIERNLRARRALVVEKPNECGYANCHNIAVGSGIYRGDREFQLCEKHLAEAKVSSDWKVLVHG